MNKLEIYKQLIRNIYDNFMDIHCNKKIRSKKYPKLRKISIRVIGSSAYIVYDHGQMYKDIK